MKKMKINYLLLVLVVMGISFTACRNDDDDVDGQIPVEPRDEQQLKDADTLLTYLGSHYYNSGDFIGDPNPSMTELVITKLADGESVPVDHTLLISAVEEKTTNYEDQEYEYYILRINQGGGPIEDKPTFSDNVRLNYSGFLTSGEVFDSTANPTEFDLTGLIAGWSRVIPEFNTAESFMINPDGTVGYNDVGVGAMFLPSGLGYYSSGSNGIAPYSCLIFKFDLLQSETNDHDLDGIPSYLEDLDGDLDFSNDDTDENGLFDFLDFDDDGDGVFTINELLPNEYIVDTNIGETDPVYGVGEYETGRTEEDGIITITTVTVVDSNNNGIDDYLDDSVSIDYNEE